MTRNDEAGPRGAAFFLSRPIIVAVVVAAAISVYIFVFHGGDTPAERAPAALDDRPLEGGADGIVEQPGAPSPPDDVVIQPGATDLRPDILDAGEGPPGAEGVEELDVPDRINPGVVQPGPPDDAAPDDQ